MGADMLAFVLGVGRVLAWIAVAAGWLLLAGLVLELLVQGVWKLTGYRFGVKGSPMYADWNFINWQWTSTKKGSIRDDPEDQRLFPRTIETRGGAFNPFCLRIVWAKERQVTNGHGPVISNDVDRAKAQEAYRKVIEYKDTGKPRLTREERLLEAIVKALGEVAVAEKLALETGQETPPDGA